MRSAVRANVGAFATRLAVSAIEAGGAVWDPQSGTVVRVRAADVAGRGAAWFRRLCVRLESRGVVSPGWLPLARYPETLWQVDGPLVVFWFDRVELIDLLGLIDVLEELGWAALWTPPAGLDSTSFAGVLGGGVVRTDVAGGRWATDPAPRGAYRLGAFSGHARPAADGALGAVECGSDPLRHVMAWVTGDALGVVAAVARNAVRPPVKRT